MRRLPAIAVVLAVALGALATPAAAATPRPCRAADLRYPFMPGGPKTFGVLRLTIVRGSCTTARRVAKAWGKAFEASSDGTDASLPRSAAGFSFTQLETTRAQEYRLRGRRGTTSIRFDYRVPNG
jgi:hypothetical protein